MTIASSLDLFTGGQLRAAVAAAGEAVKAAPGDIASRSLLAEYLCVAGELERAERQLEAIAAQDPKTTVQVMTLRQLVRADMMRRQVWKDGRAPEFLVEPPAHAAARLEALMHLRNGDVAAAAESVARAEDLRPQVSGMAGDVPFDDFRDLDDLIGGVLEVMTTTGKYYWVPMEQIEQAEFQPPSRPLDTAWRTVQLSVRGGPEGEVVIPGIYPVTGEAPSEAALTGRETDWIEEAPGFVRGQGLRCFLVGEESVSVLDLRTLTFKAD